MRRRDLLAGLSLVPLAAPAVAQCVLPGFPRINLPGRCEGDAGGIALDFLTPGSLDPRITLTRASTGTYSDSAGVIQAAAINAPRWDYDPVPLALRGLLVEEQRQNRLTNSTTLAGFWTLSNATAVASQPGAPDGTASMTRVVETATTSLHYVATTATTIASTIYTASLYAKAQQVRYLQLGVDDTATVGAYATFDLQTGTITGPLTARGSAVLGTAQIQAVGNGIYRCSISSSIATGTTMRMTIILSNVATPGFAPSYAGNIANGLLIWGMQMEAGSFVSSYIPTTGSAATRAAESMTVSVPTGTYATDAVGGTVNIAGVTYTGSASSVAGVLTFAWPAAAVTAGERHLRRLTLRQTG